MRPTLAPIVERERLRDPQNAEREFDAKFLTRSSGLFFDPVAVKQAVQARALVLYPPRHARRSFAVDLGFSKNSSAAAVVFEDDDNPGKYVLGELVEFRPQPDAPLAPSEVCTQFMVIARRHRITHVLGDQHYFESLREHVGKHLQVSMLPQGASGKEEQFVALRSVLHEGRLSIPEHPKLVQQLREVVVKPTAGGGMNITMPLKRTGEHGDLVAALVGAVWALEKARNHPHRRLDLGPLEGFPTIDSFFQN